MENKVEIGLYSVVRVMSDEVVDYGLPFCAIDDRAACGMVREALKKDDVHLKIDLSEMQIRKVGYFYPSSNLYPITAQQPMLVERCDVLMKGVEEVERENV